jgi:hypothetical protein
VVIGQISAAPGQIEVEIMKALGSRQHIAALSPGSLAFPSRGGNKNSISGVAVPCDPTITVDGELS